MKKFLPLLLLLALTVSCKSTKPLLPNVSGKAGEVIVVMDRDYWDGALGEDVRGLLAKDCPWLPVSEPLYTLINITPSGFVDLFRVHRNIVFFDINPQVRKTRIQLRSDMWAQPQCLVQVSAPSVEVADSLVQADGGKIVSAIEQAERSRVINNCILYENRELAPIVKEEFGGSLRFPTGYKLKTRSSNFIWIADEKQYTMQVVLIYSYPAEGNESDFALDNIIAKRNEILGEKVPGMFENTYMTTSTYMTPSLEYLRFRGRDFVQVRGLWEVANDFMGGPFVSHSFYSPDGKSVIVAEAFVYAPRFDKRQYLRQVESILYSWEWEKEE